jgi:hypothetical protein
MSALPPKADIRVHVYICLENISLYKKFLADPNITNDRRDLIRKLLAEEEATLLKLLSPQEPNGHTASPNENPD